MPAVPPRGPRPGRILGLYALSVMEHDGPLYGYDLSERISARTGGSWRPGAGAVYPALESLARRRFARPSQEGRRRVYRITPQGRAFLRRVRANWLSRTRAGPELGRLWSEVAGHDDPGQFLFERVRHQLDGLVDYLEQDAVPRARRETLRQETLDLLRLAERRVRAAPRSLPPVRRPRGGRSR